MKKKLEESIPEIIGGLVVEAVLVFVGWLLIDRNWWMPILVIIVGTTWVSCGYVSFKHKKKLFKTRSRGRKRAKNTRVWSYPRLRKAALVGFIGIPLVVLGTFGYQNYEQRQRSKLVIIAIADFDGPEPDRYRVTETIIAQLRKALEPYDDVEVIALNKAVTEAEGKMTARMHGNENNADVVIWGWYGATEEVVPLSVNFEILCPLKCTPELRAEVQGEVQRMEIADLESFDLQFQLSDEMVLLSLLTIGLTRYSAEDWDEAIASFSEALAYLEGHISSRDVHYYRGMAYIRRDQYEQALEDFNEAIEIDPTFAMAFNGRAVIYAAFKGDLDLAVADLTQAISLEPNNAEYYYSRGSVNTQKTLHVDNSNDYSSAIADLTQAIFLEPKNAEYYHQRGMTYYWANEYELAMDDLNQAISLFKQTDPDSYGEYYFESFARAYGYRATIYEANGDYEHALDDYNIAIGLNPNYAYAYFSRGKVHMFSGNYSRAITDLNHALELTNDPNNREIIHRQIEEILKAMEEE
ncbi:MAG: hypothetical protein CL609_23000 [Anaerolineaceae bacterium]|nr:hypothetical protein [Anaerolineaceae bacterium]